MNDILLPFLENIFYLLGSALFAVISYSVTTFLKKKNIEIKKELVEDAVKYVEQSGIIDRKLDSALSTLEYLMRDKGLKFNKEEATILIEAAIRGLKDQYGEDWGKK